MTASAAAFELPQAPSLLEKSIEMVRQADNTHIPAFSPSSDSRQTPLSMGRSIFPNDAVARIYKPSRSVMTSAPARTKGWRLAFERRTAPFVEPLMGYTGGRDPLAGVELEFPTLESAVRYAERQGPPISCRTRPTPPIRKIGRHKHRLELVRT